MITVKCEEADASSTPHTYRLAIYDALSKKLRHNATSSVPRWVDDPVLVVVLSIVKLLVLVLHAPHQPRDHL